MQEVVAPPELPVDVPEAELVVPPRPSEVLARLAEVSPPLDHLQQQSPLTPSQCLVWIFCSQRAAQLSAQPGMDIPADWVVSYLACLCIVLLL